MSNQRDTWAQWDTTANTHLLDYVAKNAVFCHPDSSYDPVTHRAVPGPIGTERTRILVAFKNSWAEDMREGPVPEDGGKAWWDDAMVRAVAQISRVESA